MVGSGIRFRGHPEAVCLPTQPAQSAVSISFCPPMAFSKLLATFPALSPHFGSPPILVAPQSCGQCRWIPFSSHNRPFLYRPGAPNGKPRRAELGGSMDPRAFFAASVACSVKEPIWAYRPHSFQLGNQRSTRFLFPLGCEPKISGG